MMLSLNQSDSFHMQRVKMIVLGKLETWGQSIDITENVIELTGGSIQISTKFLYRICLFLFFNVFSFFLS